MSRRSKLQAAEDKHRAEGRVWFDYFATLVEQRDSLLDTIDELRNTIATQSTTHCDALRVALEQGERDRQTIADLRVEVAAMTKKLVNARTVTANALDEVVKGIVEHHAMETVGDRLAASHSASMRREWDAAKDGRLLRDPATGRMISNGGDT